MNHSSHVDERARASRLSRPGTRWWSWFAAGGRPDRQPVSRDRLFGRYAALCGLLTALLMMAGSIAGPASDRPGFLLIDGLAGSAVVLAVWQLRKGFSLGLLLIAGLVLMVLGVAAGAMLTDGLDGAAVLPLAGAMLAIPVLRGRRLLGMFIVAFAASMTGETAAYLVGGMTHFSGLVEVPLSLAESGVMLAFIYGLVWWLSKEWGRASDRNTKETASQRQVLALNERLLATLDPQKVLNLIADSLKSVVAYDNLTIYRIDYAAGLLRPVLARDRFAELILESTFPFDRGITGWVVTHGEPQCVNDTLHDSRMSLIPGTPAEEEAMIVVPLFLDGKVGGTLNLGRMGGAEAYFQAGEFEVAQLFARQASIALQNAETHHAVWTRAETDALTGLRNRGAFDEDIAALLVDPAARPLTLLMLDLDGFKAFNDRHGHPAGDARLGIVARAIDSGVRSGDRVYRYGGDEFSVLLPCTPCEIGVDVAHRIRTAVSGQAVTANERITVSIGAAGTSGDNTTREALVANADSALYRAKRLGGDHVATPESPPHLSASWTGPQGSRARGRTPASLRDPSSH